MEIDLKKAKQQWHEQKMNAGRRKILFRLTFEEWLTIWIDSGQYHNRGRGTGKYVMGRIGDQGAYELGNIIIISDYQNRSDGNKGGNKTSFKIGRQMTDCQVNNVKQAAQERWKKYRQETPGKYAGWKKEKKECPHCRRLVAGQRWHFDNCRLKILS